MDAFNSTAFCEVVTTKRFPPGLYAFSSHALYLFSSYQFTS